MAGSDFGPHASRTLVSWSEGPSVVKVNNDYIVYYDHYRDPKRYEAARSADLVRFPRIAGTQLSPHLAEGAKAPRGAMT